MKHFIKSKVDSFAANEDFSPFFHVVRKPQKQLQAAKQKTLKGSGVVEEYKPLTVASVNEINTKPTKPDSRHRKLFKCY